MKTYEQLYKEALFHLRCVSGSRNSLTPEAHMAILQAGVKMRSDEVTVMHQEAVAFLNVYDKEDAPVPKPDPVPFGYFYELLDSNGEPENIWLGCPEKQIAEKSTIVGKTGTEIIALYRHPQSDPKVS